MCTIFIWYILSIKLEFMKKSCNKLNTFFVIYKWDLDLKVPRFKPWIWTLLVNRVTALKLYKCYIL